MFNYNQPLILQVAEDTLQPHFLILLLPLVCLGHLISKADIARLTALRLIITTVIVIAFFDVTLILPVIDCAIESGLQIPVNCDL